MKLVRSTLLVTGISASLLSSGPAQQASAATPADAWQVMVEAVESTTPLPATAAPTFGNFYSALYGENWPPLPADIFGVPFWDLGGGFYLLEDRNLDYAALRAEAEAEALLWAAANSHSSMMASSLLNSSYAYGNPVYLTNFLVSAGGSQPMAVSFGVAGGTNNVPYDILRSSNAAQPLSEWAWTGIGYTSNRYCFSNQPDQAFYILAKPQKTMVVGWGDDYVGESDAPMGITNAMMVAAGGGAGGGGQSLALLSDGTVVAWGQSAYGLSSVPTNVFGVTMVAAGWFHNVALLANGNVRAWGLNGIIPPYHLTEVPSNLTNATVISAQALHTLALTSNGTVVAWGYNESGETNVPPGLSNVVAIAAGFQFNLAVKADGTVTAWGNTTFGQCSVPVGLSNAVDVAAGAYHSLALLNNGTVVAWGDGSYGETNVPVGLTNVVAIAASGDPVHDSAYSLALKSDGTVVAWGEGAPVNPVGGLNNVIAIGAGGDHALAIRTGPATPVITLEPTDQYQITGGNVTFNARGAGLYGVAYQWQTNGVNISGATGATLTLTNVGTAEQGNYQVVISDGNGSVTSSTAALTLVPPPGITALTQPARQIAGYQSNVVLSVTATGLDQSQFPLGYQWQHNGTNITGATGSECSFTAGGLAGGTYSVIVSNAAGSTNASWFVQVLVAGSVCAWGADDQGQSDCPPGLTNVASMAGGLWHTLALRDNGTLVAWGDDDFGQTSLPPGLSNVTAIACGYAHSLALQADGTVAAWGEAENGETDVPAGLTNVVAIAAGGMHSLALQNTGGLTNWGMAIGPIPANLTNATAIAAGFDFDLALRADGTVAAWGGNDFGQTSVPPDLTNVVAISAGAGHGLALKSDGTVVAWGGNSAGQTNVPPGLSNVMAVAGGMFFSMALRNDGTVVVWGDNTFTQTNVPPILNGVKSIAAGGGHALAAIFSPLVQYQVDVTKDLLLIYNSTSTNSIFVKDYYLAHRPMVSGASTLGVACTNSLIMANADFTNQIVTPLLGWLAANPTKRPEYLVLFLDVPARLEEMVDIGSVSYALRQMVPGNKPFITHINMSGTNDCCGYINKLESIGTNGQVVLSASAGRYGNTNFVIDNVRFDEYIFKGGYLLGASNGLAAAGVPASSISYLDTVEPCVQWTTNVYNNKTNVDCALHLGLAHLTNGFNLAGYITWGEHSSLTGWYVVNNAVKWTGNSGWYAIETIESNNGLPGSGQGTYVQWFSPGAFGGTNYSNTPVGAVSHVAEPQLAGVNDPYTYFNLWASGRCFGAAAWVSQRTVYFQAVGDPLVRQ